MHSVLNESEKKGNGGLKQLCALICRKKLSLKLNNSLNSYFKYEGLIIEIDSNKTIFELKLLIS